MNLFLLLLSVTLILILVLSTVAPVFERKFFLIKDSYYFLVFALFVVLNKLPAALINNSLNSDEAINLAVVLSLFFDDPVLWRSADFTTLGPLHSLSFMIPGFLGFTIDYSNARIVWLLISLASFYFVYKSCIVLFGSRTGKLAFLFPGLFFGFGNIHNINHFYNEATSILVLSAALWMFASLLKQNHKAGYQAALFYFIVGLCPYMKLQSVPLGFFLALSYFIIDIQRNKNKAIYILSTVFFGLLPTLLLLCYLAYYSQVSNFINFYFVLNLNYGHTSPFWERVFTTFMVRSLNEFVISYFLKPVFLALTVVLSIYGMFKRKDWLLYFVAGFCWITIYAVSKSGYSYSHYFTYLLLPFPLLIGYGLLQLETMPWLRNIRIPVLTCYLLFISALIYINVSDSYHQGTFNNLTEKIIHFRKNDVVKSQLADELILLKKEFDKPRMVSFDWYPQIHTETGILQGAHISLPERLFGYQVSDKKSVRFSREVFLEDLKKKEPEIILIPTTTDKSYFDFTYSSFGLIPEIKQYIDGNYQFYKQVETVNIYLRKV